ncbi:MAG: DNA methyltransferase [Chloroflexi bacterium]|nr:DNA methyltransferase [Chloroflexota bacterium]
MTQAAIVQVGARPDSHRGDGGSRPTSPLHALQVRPIPFRVARDLLVRHHYLHSLPGGTRLAFGVFIGARLVGALTIGCGPSQAHCLVEGATRDDGATLTRLWLSDELPPNSESRVMGVVLRFLKRFTGVKFLVSYADPAQGHLGGIYQATGWLYTGLSEAMPLYDLGDGVARHSRSLAHAFGTHSVRHFAAHGIQVRLAPQAAKHRYIYFLDPTWRERLLVPVLPYPKNGEADGRD